MKKGLREVIVIFLSTALTIGSMGFLTARQYSYAATEFPSSGYILDTSVGQTAAENVNLQYYFNEGEKYTNKSTKETVEFKTSDGEKVSLAPNNFIHYSDNSMSSFAKSVILDTDGLSMSNGSYYALPRESKLQSQGSTYSVTNAGETMSIENFIWKLSESQYMVVSPSVTLWISQDSFQSFQGYVQVQYKDSGIAYIVNQEGTYSTVSSDAYLELDNGIRIYLGSKNISDENGILVNLTQMIVNSEDEVEIIPDEEYKNENIVEPRIVVEANDGQDGEKGEEGELGDDGEQGDAGETGTTGTTGTQGTQGTQGGQGSGGALGATGTTGEDGNEGDDGSRGVSGTTGTTGTPGTEGDPGTPGESAKTAGVTYVEVKEPQFFATITPSSYGIESLITYDMKGNTLRYGKLDELDPSLGVYDTYVSILETATGNLVYKKYPDTWQESNPGTQIDCDTLKPSTNYTYVVTATYLDTTGKQVTKDVLTKYFSTDDIGLSLKYKYTTDNSIGLELVKEVESDVTAISIKATDENGNVKYLCPTDTDGLNWVDGSATNERSTFEIKNIPVGTNLPVFVNELDSDMTYRIQIEVASFDSTITGVQKISGYTFPAETYKTLKATPSLGTPLVSVSGISKQFVISPREVNDPDNGIVSYRYEIYNAGALAKSNGSTLYFTENPVYTVSSDSQTAVRVKVDDENGKLESGNSYICRVVAVFNNNEKTIEYSSPISQVFTMDKNKLWPSASNTVTTLAPSALEGKVVITDETMDSIPREEGSWIRLYLTPRLSIKDGSGKAWQKDVLLAEVEMVTRDSNGIVTGTLSGQQIEIPYYAIGLREGTGYTLSAVISEVNIDGSRTDNNGSGVVIMTDNIETPLYYTTYDTSGNVAENGYNNLSMYLYHGTPAASTGSAPAEYFREWFSLYSVRSAGYINGTEGTGTSIPVKKGVAAGDSDVFLNTEHFSAKSIGYIEFTLLADDGKTELGYCKRYMDEGKISADTPLDTHGTTYHFINSFDLNMKVNGSKNVLPYHSGYSVDATTGALNSIPDEYGIQLTINDFTSCNTGYALAEDKTVIGTYFSELNASFWIKADVYDYTYGTIPGGGKALWRDDNGNAGNLICSLKQKFSLQASFPSWNTVSADFSSRIITKSDLGAESVGNTGATLIDKMGRGTSKTDYANKAEESDFAISNFPTDGSVKQILVDTIYPELETKTGVGLKINGPKAGIFSVAKRVKYEIYTKLNIDQQDNCIGLYSAYKIGESPWLTVDQNSSSSELPTWYYLVDYENAVRDNNIVNNGADRNTSAGQSNFLGRGYEFYVVAKIELSDKYKMPVYGDGRDSTVSANHNPASLGISTDNGIYPDDYIPAVNEQGYDVTGYLYKKYIIDKQAPEILVAQKDGIIKKSGNQRVADTSYYVWFKDPDEALASDSASEYLFYKNDYSRIQFFQELDTGNKINNLFLKENQDDLTKTNFPYILYDNNSGLGSKCDDLCLLWKKNINIDNANADIISIDSRKGDLPLGSPAIILTKANIDAAYADGITEIKNFLCYEVSESKDIYFGGTRNTTLTATIDETQNTVKVSFWYAAKKMEDLLRYDLSFDGTVMSYDVSANLSFKFSSDDWKLIEKPDDGKEFKYFKLEKVIDCTEYADLMAFAGCDSVMVEATVYSDGNKYGTDVLKNDSYVSMLNFAADAYQFCYADASGVINFATSSTMKNMVMESGSTADVTDYVANHSSEANVANPIKIPTDLKQIHFRYNANYEKGGAYNPKWIASDYTSEGLKYIPRSVNLSKGLLEQGIQWQGQYDAKVNRIVFTPGYSKARMNIEIGSYNNVDKTKPLKVFYAPAGTFTDANSAPTTFSGWMALVNAGKAMIVDTPNISDFGTSTSLNLDWGGTNLESNTQYYFSVYAYYGISDSWTALPLNNVLPHTKRSNNYYIADKTTVTGLGYFWTNERIQIVPTNLTFSAKPDSRSSKTLSVSLQGKNVIYSDLNNYVDCVSLVIKNSNGDIVETISDINESDKLAILNALKSQYTTEEIDNETAKTFDAVVEIPWQPDPTHIMNGAMDYTAEVVIYYTNGTIDRGLNPSTASPDIKVYSDMAKTALDVPDWSNTDEYGKNSYFMVIPKASYDYEGTNGKDYDGDGVGDDNAVLTLSISGIDKLRIFDDINPGEPSGDKKITYKVELMSGDTPVEGCTVTRLVKIDENGEISKVAFDDIVFNNLKPSAKMAPDDMYWLRISVPYDYDNDGDFTDSSGNKEYMVVRTEKITTPGRGLGITSIVIMPGGSGGDSSRTVVVTGTNLEYLTKIKYTLYEDSILKGNKDTVINPKTSNLWQADSAQSDTYYLRLTAINDLNKSYELQIYFEAIDGDIGIDSKESYTKWYSKGVSGVLNTIFKTFTLKLASLIKR